jgi:GDP-mannose 6-dehydrogenase
MRVSVFGLGYVGAVTATCLANDGHTVIGVDVNEEKAERINDGRSPIVEPGIDDLLRQAITSGRLSATTDHRAAIERSDLSLISVGTPPTRSGEPNLEYVFGVCKQIGEALAGTTSAHVVVLRSTVPPGTLERCREIVEQASGDTTTAFAFNPEFLREGSAVRDYYDPPYTVIGTTDAAAETAVRELYKAVQAPVHVVAPGVAELVKVVANAWHATKIAFANEVGRVSHALGIDGRDVMGLIAADTKLNASSAYMRPGFAYGGSCLPKDTAALIHYARAHLVDTPLLNAVPSSNASVIDAAVDAVLRSGARDVTVLGLAFKAGTDDLRDSPAVSLVKRLLGEGCRIRVFDPFVSKAWIMGTNLAYVQATIPHFESLLIEDPAAALQSAELAVITYATPEFATILAAGHDGLRVLDLAGQFTEAPEGREYHGLAW